MELKLVMNESKVLGQLHGKLVLFILYCIIGSFPGLERVKIHEYFASL